MKKRIFTLNEPNAPRINPALAKEIGLNESLILLQIEFWISISNNERDGKRWTYQSVRDMQDKSFSFWSISTINRAVNKLIDKGYIIEGNYNKKKYDKTRWFALNFEKLNELESISINGDDTRSSQNDTRSSQNDTTIPETTTETTTDKKVETSKKFDKASIEYKISEYLYSRILKNDPKYKKPNLQNWATHIDYLIRLDGRSPAEIKSVVNFVTTDDFEKVNVLSTRKLRERFGQLYIKTMNTKENKESSYSPREERNFV